MTNVIEESRHAAPVKTINLQVRYIGARKPYIDPKADPNSTLSQIKGSVLDFFHLTEGSVDGGIKTYLFGQDGKVLADQNAKLGTLAEGKHELKLDIIERFEQG